MGGKGKLHHLSLSGRRHGFHIIHQQGKIRWRLITHPNASLRQIRPHCNLLSRAHVGVSITAKRLFQLVQLLRSEVSPLTSLPLVLFIILRIVRGDWLVGIFLLHLRVVQPGSCGRAERDEKLFKSSMGKRRRTWTSNDGEKEVNAERMVNTWKLDTLCNDLKRRATWHEHQSASLVCSWRRCDDFVAPDVSDLLSTSHYLICWPRVCYQIFRLLLRESVSTSSRNFNSGRERGIARNVLIKNRFITVARSKSTRKFIYVAFAIDCLPRLDVSCVRNRLIYWTHMFLESIMNYNCRSLIDIRPRNTSFTIIQPSR